MIASHIRNFCIIAHIDHGKSTLADRILEATGAVEAREMQAQYLDSMDLERERGITIKSQAVQLTYKAEDGETYIFHLIDTPGHVDFNYEVSRSLAACEGALLVVDAAQGVEAQTLANVYLAIDGDLAIIPVLNKVDLPAARPDEVRREIEEGIGLDASGAILCSAKSGLGIAEVLEAVVREIPPPRGKQDGALRALIFDSQYDTYRGVLVQIRVVDGTLRKGDKVRFLASDRDYEVLEVRVHKPQVREVQELTVGEVGVIVCGIKQISDVKIGDTVTHAKAPTTEPLAGFKEVQQMVYSGIFPVESHEYETLRDALQKLSLNDAAFTWEPETSAALGFGFRCGFLGLLHMEVIQERLEREYDCDLITTAPSVVYHVKMNDGTMRAISSPAELPDSDQREAVEEPFVLATIHAPSDYVGAVVKLCTERRGIQRDLRYLTEKRVVIEYEMPLAEIIYDFFDRLKTVTRGYGSLDYEVIEFRAGKLVKLDVLVAGENVDALSLIVHQDTAYERGRDLVERLRKLIPRQQFDVPIQAAIARRIIARETIKALRKDVTAKCYGGDISRKRKLLEKQKKGKKRMKQVGNVEIPQSAFLAVLSSGD
ncbi:MAG: elongation factor 4 [Deltaproteobacteria bacterium]|nr:elongation factor 4 [Deltaproteobacteria bacterium]